MESKSIIDRAHKTARLSVGSNEEMENGRRISESSSTEEKDLLKEDMRKGLISFRAVGFLSFWYFFSFTTLFLNKYILSYWNGDPTVLASFQLLLCGICGYAQKQYPCGLYRKVHRETRPPNFFRNVILVGTLRFSTVVLGLIALWYVPVSFAETVKSSAPVFTVVIAWLVLGESTSWLVNISLIPVMGGLALCSANELHFHTKGFLAALATNISECLQNVFSKMLLSGEVFKFTSAELQFFTSLSSVFLQIPVWFFLVDFEVLRQTFNYKMLLAYVLGGISFHCQSISEYMLLSYVSPVTHSVANTFKRALLIWLSILTFGNPVTFLSALGTAIVIMGVLFYNKAMQRTFSVSTNVTLAKQDVHSV